MSVGTDLLKLSLDIEASERKAGDAWRKAIKPCYVLTQDGKYMQADGTWGTKKKIFQTYQTAENAATSATSSGYHFLVFLESNDKSCDPRDKGLSAKSWVVT